MIITGYTTSWIIRPRQHLQSCVLSKPSVRSALLKTERSNVKRSHNYTTLAQKTGGTKPTSDKFASRPPEKVTTEATLRPLITVATTTAGLLESVDLRVRLLPSWIEGDTES